MREYTYTDAYPWGVAPVLPWVSRNLILDLLTDCV